MRGLLGGIAEQLRIDRGKAMLLRRVSPVPFLLVASLCRCQEEESRYELLLYAGN